LLALLGRAGARANGFKVIGKIEELSQVGRKCDALKEPLRDEAWPKASASALMRLAFGHAKGDGRSRSVAKGLSPAFSDRIIRLSTLKQYSKPLPEQTK